MSSTIKIKRGTRQAITDLAIKGGLSEGEPLLITDEGRMAVATAPTSFSNTAMLSDTFGFKNKIHNGKMEIAQRGVSFPAIASGLYSLDRWRIGYATGAVVTVSQQSDVPSDNEFQSSLRVAVTTADNSIAAGDYFFVQQFVEGFNVRDLIGRTFTLSFRVRSSKTGVHCIGFGNFSLDRSFVAEYTVNSANTWETKTITVPSGLITAGTWNWTTERGLAVQFILACGSTFQTTAGSWQTGNFLATANQVNCLDTVGNIFAITGVQLEVGPVATPFEHRPYGIEEFLCKRYLQRLARLLSYGRSSTDILIHCMLPVPMRITPAASLNTTTPYWENSVFSTIGTLTGATVDAQHFSSVGGTLLISGTFSPAPTYGSMSEFDGNSIFLTADL